ncbi:MAG: tetratricopeptide repeat protein [Promethearchaeota archaeon]|nr:MAG: tetratricopeptide repeat protein [Candidatus Lokiarchaeota archaeon]
MTKKNPEMVQIESLIDAGNYDKAYKFLNSLNFENFEENTQLILYRFMSFALRKLSRNKESIAIADLGFKKSNEIGNILLAVDFLNLQIISYIWMYRLRKASKLINKVTNLLSTIKEKDSEDFKKRFATIVQRKGALNWLNGNVNMAVELCEESLKIQEELGNEEGIMECLLIIGLCYTSLRTRLDEAIEYAQRCQSLAVEINDKETLLMNQNTLGKIFSLKGLYNKALYYLNQALSIAENLKRKLIISAIFNNIAIIYHHKGEFDKAISTFEKALVLAQEIKNKVTQCIICGNLEEVYLLKGDINQSKFYFLELEKIYNEKSDNKKIEYVYRINKALLLKENKRIHDTAEAEQILKELVQEEDLQADTLIQALILLCDLLMEEIYQTENLEIVEEIKPYINQLIKISKLSNSYWVVAETYTLLAKLKLLDSNFKEAKKLLKRAQNIADNKGMHLLGVKISAEHDKLLNQLNLWKRMGIENITLKQRLKFADMNDQIERLIWKRDLSSIKPSEEDPILLLVLAKGGTPVLSHIFTEEWSHDDDLVGGFLSALDSFIGELFSEGLDRAVFGKYMVIVKSFNSFSIFYLFKGQSYMATKRLDKFVENIVNSKELKRIFDRFYENHVFVELKKYPHLERIFNEIFIERSQLLIKEFDSLRL